MMSEDINTQPSTDTTSTTTDTNTNTTSLVGGYDDTWSWEDYKNDKMPKDYDTKDFDDNFITIAKDLKLSKEQAYALRQKVLDNDIEEYNTELSTKEANRVKELTDLQQEWGSTFNFRVQSINKTIGFLFSLPAGCQGLAINTEVFSVFPSFEKTQSWKINPSSSLSKVDGAVTKPGPLETISQP